MFSGKHPNVMNNTEKNKNLVFRAFKNDPIISIKDAEVLFNQMFINTKGYLYDWNV